MTKNGYAHPEVLVETAWLSERLAEPTLCIVEMDVDTQAYDSGHIPQAIGWNWQLDTRDVLRRNLPDKPAFEDLMRRSGITNETTVILYGDKNNWFATYAFWLLKYYRHTDVRLLNGGRKKWIAEGRPLTLDEATRTPTSYTAKEPDLSIRSLRQYVVANFEKAETALVDVRSAKEFSGELTAPDFLPEEGAQRGGHIPGAVNISWGQNIRADGTFKSAKALHNLYERYQITSDKEIITYCRIGERSSHTWFVLTYLLGYPQVCNYDGSWAEWGNLIDVPIER